MTDEKVIAYIKKCLESGRMSEALDTSKITGVPISKEEINMYIRKYLENGWMQKAIDGSKAASIELSNDEILIYINKYLEEGKIYSAVDACRITGFPLPKEKIAITGKECLAAGKLTSGLEAYKLIKENPPEDELVICGSICFKEGRLSHGVEAYKLANRSPPEDELISCGNVCLNTGQITPGLEAYKMANMTPTRELLRICGEACLLEKRTDDARKSFVAAQKVADLKNSGTIEVREISLQDLKNLKDIDTSWKGFGQKTCSDCGAGKDFKERFFIASRCPQTEEDEEQLDRIMKDQHRIENYFIELDVLGNGRGLINSSVCTNCGSKNVNLDSGYNGEYAEIKAPFSKKGQS